MEKERKRFISRIFRKNTFVIVVLLLVLLTTGVLISVEKISNLGEGLDRTSLEYVNEAVPAISTEWSVDEIEKRSSSEFMSQTNHEELIQLFTYLNEKLGRMKTYEGAEGEANILLINSKKDIKANYVVKGAFEKGEASIQISLIRKADKWYLLGYRVNSEVFKPY